MKLYRFFSMLLMATIMCLGVVGCSDDDDNNTGGTINYSTLLPGHWENTNTSDDIYETLGINYKGAGTISFYNLVDQEYGVMAYGTYTLNSNKIVAVYNDVKVETENGSTTYMNFTNGKSKTVTYTIVSCDGKKLVLKDDSGRTLNYQKYADLK